MNCNEYHIILNILNGTELHTDLDASKQSRLSWESLLVVKKEEYNSNRNCIQEYTSIVDWCVDGSVGAVVVTVLVLLLSVVVLVPNIVVLFLDVFSIATAARGLWSVTDSIETSMHEVVVEIVSLSSAGASFSSLSGFVSKGSFSVSSCKVSLLSISDNSFIVKLASSSSPLLVSSGVSSIFILFFKAEMLNCEI